MSQRLTTIFMDMAKKAQLLGYPPPVIRTDMNSAMILSDAIEEDLGCRLGFCPDWELGKPIFRFCGVAVIGECESKRDEFHEHFGVLADIWGE